MKHFFEKLFGCMPRRKLTSKTTIKPANNATDFSPSNECNEVPSSGVSVENDAPYQCKINQISLKNDNVIIPEQINIFVGANNCGKTRVLKDMLLKMTADTYKTTLINDLDIATPSSTESILSASSIKLRRRNSGECLITPAPTFERPTRPREHENIKEYLQRNINYKEYDEIFSCIGESLVTFLNTDNRLRLAQSQQISSFDSISPENALFALYESYDVLNDAAERIRKYVQDTFQVDLYFDYTDLSSICFRVGDCFDHVSKDSREAFQQVKDYPILDHQGDGLRSFVGILVGILAVNKPIILLDEPEAFLHPPQALQLGKIIASLLTQDQQLFVATHSADFLRGFLSETSNANIIHLDRCNNDDLISNILDKEILNKVITDPLLSSSRVLEGMFYKGVVVTEADADAVFYQRLFQKIGASDEIHFVQAHNKQTLKNLVSPYHSLGIKVVLIADTDVIRTEVEFKAILNSLTTENVINSILDNRKVLLSSLTPKTDSELLSSAVKETEALLEKLKTNQSDATSDSVSLDTLKRELKKIRNNADSLLSIKKDGRNSSELDEEALEQFNSLCEECSTIGLFIVPIGELESWLEDYGVTRSTNKKKWIVSALDTIRTLEEDGEKEVWKFLRQIQDYLKQ